MYGSIGGTLCALAYYMYFQLIGCVLVSRLFFRGTRIRSGAERALFGSVTGSLLHIWLPALFSFVWGFTLTAHIVALAAALPALLLLRRTPGTQRTDAPHNAATRSDAVLSGARCAAPAHLPFVVVLCLVLCLYCYLLFTHTLLPAQDGSLYTGQATYGDMNLHLSFITSLAVQQSFPPDYSILPGAKLCYPFLSDSVSSSFLVLGATLRAAYILPMLFALTQLFCTVYLAAYRLFSSVSKALLTLLLFFGNGGFGFVWFFDWATEGTYSLAELFNGFYTTPTNLVDRNIRWVNVFVDILLPQRASLFGYAALVPALYLLYRAVFCKDTRLFLPAGLFVAALPLLHTHSFLCAGVISAVFLLVWLLRRLQLTQPKAGYPLIFAAAALCAVLCLVQALCSRGLLSSGMLIGICLSVFAAALLCGIVLLLRFLAVSGWKPLSGWGIYLLCVLLLALPQLVFFTFGQVSEGSFIQGHFNWSNQGDFYIWFYVRNLGIILLPILGALCACKKKLLPLCLSAILLWWLAELIAFTPNTYDNNKILYVAYLLLCPAAADYCVSLYHRLRGLPGRLLLAASFLVCASLSAGLTLGREVRSSYQLYNPSQAALAAYVADNTATDAMFLTDTRHNNEIASLAGRNIVCGSDVFLVFHGLDSTVRKQEVRQMYEFPLQSAALFEKYDISFVVISSYERSSYLVNEDYFRGNCTAVFSSGDAVLYALP